MCLAKLNVSECEKTARPQIGEDCLSQTRRKSAPIVAGAKPDQFPDLRLRARFARQPGVKKLDAHLLFRLACRLVNVHADKFLRDRLDLAQFFAQFAGQALERRFPSLALASRQYQELRAAFLAAQ